MAEFEGNATYSCEIKVLFHFMSFPVLPSIIKYMLQLQTVQFALTLTKRIEFIIEWNLLEKEYETAILLYCFHTAGVIHIFMLYNLLGPGISFYRKLLNCYC